MWRGSINSVKLGCNTIQAYLGLLASKCHEVIPIRPSYIMIMQMFSMK